MSFAYVPPPLNYEPATYAQPRPGSSSGVPQQDLGGHVQRLGPVEEDTRPYSGVQQYQRPVTAPSSYVDPLYQNSKYSPRGLFSYSVDELDNDTFRTPVRNFSMPEIPSEERFAGSSPTFQYGPPPPKTSDGVFPMFPPRPDLFERPMTADARLVNYVPPPYNGNGHVEPIPKQYNFIQQGGQTTKRPRRRYDEIERLYDCNYPGCTKAYGTLNHLNSHKTMQKHGPRSTPAEFKERRKLWREQKKREAAMTMSARGIEKPLMNPHMPPSMRPMERPPNPEYFNGVHDPAYIPPMGAPMMSPYSHPPVQAAQSPGQWYSPPLAYETARPFTAPSYYSGGPAPAFGMTSSIAPPPAPTPVAVSVMPPSQPHVPPLKAPAPERPMSESLLSTTFGGHSQNQIPEHATEVFVDISPVESTTN